MHRYAALLLVALLAAAALVAAPAPFPRPERKTGPWFDGWGKPIDPVGDCRFERRSEKLTVTVPASDRRCELPRLLRTVEGDFIVEVRVSKNLSSDPNPLRAGIVLSDGRETVWLERRFDGASPVGRGDEFVFSCRSGEHGRATTFIYGVAPGGETTYLRLQRQGDFVKAAVSRNGKLWIEVGVIPGCPPDPCKLLRKLKVGVAVEATESATVKVEFDQFKLTPLGGKAR
jgi:hypothetical protein